MRWAILLVPILLLSVLLIVPQAEAAPIFFEEDFRGCGDGNAPSGWFHSPVGIGFSGCDNGEFYPDLSPFAFVNGSESLQQRLTGSLIDGWGSPVFSISGATNFELGFAVRFEAFPSSTFGGAFQFTFRDGGASAGGFGTRDNGQVHTLNVNSIWDNQFFQLVLNTWYVVTFRIDRNFNNYSTSINGTVIDSTQTMAPGGGAHDIDTVGVSNRLSGKSWVDWIFTDQVTLSPIADQTLSLCENFVEKTLLIANADATTDVIFNITNRETLGAGLSPSFLTIVPATGRLILFGSEGTGPASGGPPIAGTFPINVSVEVSTGIVQETFTLTVEECDPFAWIREFAPAWAIFLITFGVVFFLILTLWRGARGNPFGPANRRRRRR